MAADLMAHVRGFLDAEDVSPAVVGHMAHLLDTFEGAAWQEELVVPLARYEPWGSPEWDGYYTTKDLGQVLQAALPFIEGEAIA